MTTTLASQIAPVIGILWAASWLIAITFVGSGDGQGRRHALKK